MAKQAGAVCTSKPSPPRVAGTSTGDHGRCAGQPSCSEQRWQRASASGTSANPETAPAWRLSRSRWMCWGARCTSFSLQPRPSSRVSAACRLNRRRSPLPPACCRSTDSTHLARLAAMPPSTIPAPPHRTNQPRSHGRPAARPGLPRRHVARVWHASSTGSSRHLSSPRRRSAGARQHRRPAAAPASARPVPGAAAQGAGGAGACGAGHAFHERLLCAALSRAALC